MRSWIRSIADNVKQLRVAWTFRTGELATYEGTKASEKAAFEATPIVIRDTLYFSTPTTRVFALDANTGKQRCTYNPEVDLTKHYSEITSRGVSYWKNPEANDPAQDRVFVPTLDARLIALNAHTGKLVREFGKDGEVDMKDGVGNVREVPLGTLGNPDKYPDSDDWGSISLGGAITTASGLVFIASTLDGHLRAFDIQSGKQLWLSKLPAGGQATPMSYRVGTSPQSKHYVVIAAGGHGKLGTPLGDYVVSYSLP
jgi:glucose dehydrogenase